MTICPALIIHSKFSHEMSYVYVQMINEIQAVEGG